MNFVGCLRVSIALQIRLATRVEDRKVDDLEEYRDPLEFLLHVRLCYRSRCQGGERQVAHYLFRFSSSIEVELPDRLKTCVCSSEPSSRSNQQPESSASERHSRLLIDDALDESSADKEGTCTLFESDSASSDKFRRCFIWVAWWYGIDVVTPKEALALLLNSLSPPSGCGCRWSAIRWSIKRLTQDST
jgi:hypothetical protein